MTFDEYQDRAANTAIYPGQGTVQGLIYTGLGLGEVGEFQNTLKKVVRDDNSILTEEKRKELVKELSDVLWYVAMASKELGYNLSYIAHGNIEKLESRKARGVLNGSGNDR